MDDSSNIQLSKLFPGAVFASKFSECEIEGCRAIISKATIGLREVWFVVIAGRKGFVTLRGPGRCEPSAQVLDCLVGQHRAFAFARNRENN